MNWPHIRLQKSPNAWSCLPTAFAMATNIPYEDWLDAIGHDGSKVIFENLPEPQNRRGFHPQELIRACLDFGIAVTELQTNPTITTDGKNLYPISFEGGNANRFEQSLRGQRAVLGGVTCRWVGHAVAWDGDLNLVYDCALKEPVKLWHGMFFPRQAYILSHVAT